MYWEVATMMYANGVHREGENKSLVNDFYVSVPINGMTNGGIYKLRDH